jgi:hypothetical protein
VARSRIKGGTARPSALTVFEVQNHLEFCRTLHREIARLLAAQDTIEIVVLALCRSNHGDRRPCATCVHVILPLISCFLLQFT